MNNKKEIEKFYLTEFFKILGIKASNIQDGEAPDFIIGLGHRKIGIELTEFHSALKGAKEKPRREIEQSWAILQNDIMNEVEKYTELRNTYGTLCFTNIETPSKLESKCFINELIEVSIEMVMSDKSQQVPSFQYPLLKKYLKKIIIEKTQCHITWEWNHNASFISLSEDDLIKTIKPKTEKVASYKKKKIDELWLIIVSGVRLSQTMPMHLTETLKTFNQLGKLLKVSNYNKVFIYQYQIGVIHEWPTWKKIGKEQIYPTIDDAT